MAYFVATFSPNDSIDLSDYSGEVTTCIEAKNFALALEEATKQEPNFALIGYRLTNLLLDAD